MKAFLFQAFTFQSAVFGFFFHTKTVEMIFAMGSKQDHSKTGSDQIKSFNQAFSISELNLIFTWGLAKSLLATYDTMDRSSVNIIFAWVALLLLSRVAK